MKQKLGLCCALIHEPDVSILDEPTTGVDPLSRRQFWELIDSIRAEHQGMSVLVSTVNMDEAQRFNWLIAMDAGRVLATGTPDEINSEHKNGNFGASVCRTAAARKARQPASADDYLFAAAAVGILQATITRSMAQFGLLCMITSGLACLGSSVGSFAVAESAMLLSLLTRYLATRTCPTMRLLNDFVMLWRRPIAKRIVPTLESEYVHQLLRRRHLSHAS